MQKLRLLKNLFKLGVGHYQEHNENARKELLNYLETNGSDCQIEDGLRILDIWHEESINNDYKKSFEIAAPILSRLSDDSKWDFYDIRILVCVVDYAGTYIEVYNLAEKILAKLEDHSHEDAYSSIKLAVYGNTMLRLLRARYFDSENLMPSYELEKRFSRYTEEALSLSEELGLEVHKTSVLMRKGMFYKLGDLINHGFYRLKELGEMELYRVVELEFKEYEFFKKIQFNKFQFNKTVGDNIRKLRHEANLTLARVGEITGIPPSDLSHIEIGKKAATSYDLFALAEFFNVSIDFFFRGIENRKFITDERTIMIMDLRNLSESYSVEQLEHLWRYVKYVIR